MSRAASDISPAGSAGGPYDSVREFLNDLETRGHVERIAEIDQDAFEFTGLIYRLLDRLGYEKSPAIVVERVKVDGQWREGPVLANQFGRWEDEALVFGVKQISSDEEEMYWAVMNTMFGRLDSGGNWKRIPPVEFAGIGKAPCPTAPGRCVPRVAERYKIHSRTRGLPRRRAPRRYIFPATSFPAELQRGHNLSVASNTFG